MPVKQALRRIARLESAMVARAGPTCPLCAALEPGGPGGSLEFHCLVLPTREDPTRAHVMCGLCARSVVGTLDTAGTRISGCVLEPLPV